MKNKQSGTSAKTSPFSFLAFLKKRINAIDSFFGRLYDRFKSLWKRLMRPSSIKVVFIDKEGKVSVKWTPKKEPYDMLFNKYLEARNKPATTEAFFYWSHDGLPAKEYPPSSEELEELEELEEELELLCFSKKQRAVYIYNNTLEEDDDYSYLRPAACSVSAILKAHETKMGLKPGQSGKLMAFGQVLKPETQLQDLPGDDEPLSVHYIPFKAEYVPTYYTLRIKPLSKEENPDAPQKDSVIEVESTQTLTEVLEQYHKTVPAPALAQEETEGLFFLGHTFKNHQVVDEIVALANSQNQQELTLEVVKQQKPMSFRIFYDKEVYRIEADISETLPNILKRYHSARMTNDETGKLTVVTYYQNTKTQEIERQEQPLDNEQTLEKQGIRPGDELWAEYSPPPSSLLKP